MRRQYLPEDQLFEKIRAVLRKPGNAAEDNSNLAAASLTIGRMLFHAGLFSPAETVLGDSVLLAEKVQDPDRLRLATHLEAHAEALGELEQFSRGIAALSRAIDLRRAANKPEAELAEPLSKLCSLFYVQGAFAESAAACRQALTTLESRGIDETTVQRGVILTSLAVALIEIDNTDPEGDAESLAREGLALHIEALGPGHLQSVNSRNNLATVLGRSGQLEEALSVALENLKWAEKTLGRDHLRLAYIHTGLASGYRHFGDPESCVKHARRAVTLRAAGLPPGNRLIAFSQMKLAPCLNDLGRRSEAIALLDAAIEALESSKAKNLDWLTQARAQRTELTTDPDAPQTGP